VRLRNHGHSVASVSTQSIARSLACLVLLVEPPGCGRCTDDMAQHHVEGLLPGYSQLKCILYDYDSTVIAFSYTLPKDMTSEKAFELLEASVNRSMWKEGVTPPVTCYRVVARRKDYLLMACEEPGLGPTSAWEFLLEGRSLRVTTGPGHDVMRFVEYKLVGASP